MLVLTTKQKDLGPLLPVVCPHCGSETFYKLLKTRRWATILWKLPLMPVSGADYFLFCPACESALEAEGKDADELAEMRDLTAEWLDYEVSDRAYADALDKRMGDYYADADELRQTVEGSDESDSRGYH